MNKELYDYVIRNAARDCGKKGCAVEQLLYKLSCDNNKAFRDGKSSELTYLDNGVERYARSIVKSIQTK